MAATRFTEDATGKEYLVFRGTDNPIWTGKDWVANGGNSLRGYSVQIGSALSVTQEEKELTGGNLTLIGHSLGGALASVSAQTHNLAAITFNAAGVKGPIDEGSNITAFYVSSEGLSLAQDNTPLPSAGGDRIALPAVPVEGGGRLELHSMDSVIRALNAAGYNR